MSLQKFTFRWNEKRVRAAQLVAEDLGTDEQIAGNLGISRQQLAAWKRHPEFAARVAEIVEAYRDRVLSHGIAKLERRIAAKHDRWMRAQRVIRERAEDPAMANIPGGASGLLVRQVKSIGFGKDSQVVEEYVTDTGLLRAIADLEREGSQELGQWASKVEHSGPDGGPIPIMALDLIINAAEMASAAEAKTTQRALNSGGHPPE